MLSLIPVNTIDDILPEYRGTPVERLLRFQNLGEPPVPNGTGRAELLIGMCMDYRKYLMLPNEFAYIIRTAGGNLRSSSFEISFAIGVGGISTIALLAHTDCGMARVKEKREAFVDGLVERAGWDRDAALSQFNSGIADHEIGEAEQFVYSEASRLRGMYPRILIAPLMYQIGNDKLAQIVEQTPEQADYPANR